MCSVNHVQKDGSEFSNVTLASEDDNDNSDVIVLKKLKKLSIGDLQDALHCNISSQKDCSEFSNVTFAYDDDNDNSDLIECDQEVDKTPIEDYILTIIVNRSLFNFLITLI